MNPNKTCASRTVSTPPPLRGEGESAVRFVVPTRVPILEVLAAQERLFTPAEKIRTALQLRSSSSTETEAFVRERPFPVCAGGISLPTEAQFPPCASVDSKP